jgi:hypothetical protein
VTATTKEGLSSTIAPTQRHLGRFFVPLALQAASQSFTYPLVAVVASRGEGGPLDLAGLAQSNLVMFFLAMLGAGIPATGMIYAKTRQGYATFSRVNYAIAAAVVGLQGILSIPPLDHIVFGHLIGLPLSIEAPARMTLFWSLPLQFLFFVRNPYQVVLLNGKATGRASGATLVRIAMTAAMASMFCMFGWVGPWWAVVCLTIPVGFEAILSWTLARAFLKALPSSPGADASFGEMLAFTMPLSVGGLFLALSGPLLGAIMSRAPEPERVLPVYYLAMGLANTMAFSASRVQAVVLAFPPSDPEHGTTLRFSVVAGVILGAIPLLFIIHPLAELYYVSLQKLPAADLPLLRVTALALLPLPLCVALRSHYQGLAALLKRPVYVMIGETVHLGALVAASLFGLLLDAAGYLIGPLGLLAGNASAAAVIRVTIRKTQANRSATLPSEHVVQTRPRSESGENTPRASDPTPCDQGD